MSLNTVGEIMISVNPLDQRKRLRVLAKQLGKGVPLTCAQAAFLANAFALIADGEDANKILGVKFSRGNNPTQAATRQKMSGALHWVACAIDKELGYGYTLEKACEEAVRLFELDYDLEYVKKKWNKYKHMQSCFRAVYEPDSPID
jgi:hypothetical protein